MKENLQISSKMLASKQASKQAFRLYIDIGRAERPFGKIPCTMGAEALVVQGIFCVCGCVDAVGRADPAPTVGVYANALYTNEYISV